MPPTTLNSEEPYYSHSIAERQGSMNAICCLKSDLIYSSLREIVPKLELSWNSGLSSTSARDSGE